MENYPISMKRRSGRNTVHKRQLIVNDNKWQWLTCGQEGRGGVKGHAGHRNSVNGPPGASTLSFPPIPLLQQQSSASCYQHLWRKAEERRTCMLSYRLGEECPVKNFNRLDVVKVVWSDARLLKCLLYLIIKAECERCDVLLIILQV